MERRVQKTEDNRLSVHNAHCSLYGSLDERLQLGKCRTSLIVSVAENHLAELCERSFGILAIEHMLDTEQADTFRTELESLLCILRSIGVGTDTEPAVFVHDRHESDEIRILGSVHCSELAGVNHALAAVKAQEVALVELLGAVAEAQSLLCEIDLQRLAAYDTALAPSACHESSVGSHTSALGKNTCGSSHTFNILRRSLFAHENRVDTVLACSHGGLGGEDDLTYRSTRRCRKACGQFPCVLFGLRVENWVQDFVKLLRSDSHHCGLLVDHTLVEHIDGHLQCGQTCTLADTALEHPELALLDGELDVLHIAEVLLQMSADIVEFCIYLRHSCFQRCEMAVVIILRSLVERVRCTDTGNYVLALGIDEPLAIELVVTCGRVSGECYTCS